MAIWLEEGKYMIREWTSRMLGEGISQSRLKIFFDIQNKKIG